MRAILTKIGKISTQGFGLKRRRAANLDKKGLGRSSVEQEGPES